MEETTKEGKKKQLSRRDFVKIAAQVGGVAAGATLVGSTLVEQAFAGPKPPFDTPTLNCVGSTQHTIFLQVCAGASGAPAGFSVQWNPLPEGTACGDFVWPDDATLCKGSFSGVPGCSDFTLGSNACVTVEIGNLNDAQCGLSTQNCGANELECGTTYVFRAFAHATSQKNRSAFTANKCCATEDCVEGCVRTQGYWKTHACDWPSPFVPGTPDGTDLNGNGTPDNLEGQAGVSGNNPNSQCPCDAVNTINIGTNSYNQCQLLEAFWRPGGGNALVILAHQLITAELNILAGAAPPPDCDLAAAHALIGSLDVTTGSVATGGSGNTLGPAMTAAAACLDLYNNGDGGVTHCP